MPQHTQHPLIHVLLLWITVLSIVQIACVVFFFTAGHHGLSQNSSAVAPDHTVPNPANKSARFSSNRGLPLGKMLTFKFKEVKNTVMQWEADVSDPALVSEEEEGKVLEIVKDGYFFLNLHVTLTSCNSTLKPPFTVRMRLKGKDTEVLLQGAIHSDTCSTAIGKVEMLSTGSKLQVTIEGATAVKSIDESKFLTHLDIIYMQF